MNRRAKVTLMTTPERDRYAKLADCMGVSPEEVPRLIQEHSPWNGRTICENAVRERDAAAHLFRCLGQSLMAQVVERGDHLAMYDKYLNSLKNQ